MDFTGRCHRCRGDLDLPLYCKECKKWFCARCWNIHDVEMMKEMGLLRCSCGDDHD